MSITIPRNDLKEAIASLSKVIAKNPSEPILSGVRIGNSITGLGISASNLNESLTFSIKGRTDYPMPLIVNINELKEYLEKTRTASIYTLTKNYAGNVIISTDIEEYPEKTIMSYKEIDAPVMPDTAIKTNNNPISGDTLKAIQSVLPSVASNENARAALKYLLLEEKAVIASNGRELVKIACDTGVKEQILIPATKFISSAVFSDRDSTIGIKNSKESNYLAISNDKWEYCLKLPEETYPNYMCVVPKENSHSFTLPKREIERLRIEIPLMGYSSELKPVHLYLDKDKLSIFSENLKGKPITLNLESTENSTPILKTLSRSLLLRAFSLGFDKFSFSEGLSPVMASNNSDSFMVFMPIRTNEEIAKHIHELIGLNNSNIKTPNKEESKMETPTAIKPTNYTPTFQGAETKTDLIEELIGKVTSVRNKAREVIDITIDVSNQLRNMQKANRAKEREFKSANELLEKLKKVSGF